MPMSASPMTSSAYRVQTPDEQAHLLDLIRDSDPSRV